MFLISVDTKIGDVSLGIWEKLQFSDFVSLFFGFLHDFVQVRSLWNVKKMIFHSIMIVRFICWKIFDWLTREILMLILLFLAPVSEKLPILIYI